MMHLLLPIRPPRAALPSTALLLAALCLACAQPVGTVHRENIADLAEVVLERTEQYAGPSPSPELAAAIATVRATVVDTSAEEVHVSAFSAELERVLEAHDAGVTGDGGLTATERARYLRSSELLREVLAAAQRAPPGESRAGPGN